MTIIECKDLKDLAKRLERDMRAREKRVRATLPKVLRKAKQFIDNHTMPVAFGELRKSGEIAKTGDGSALEWDAPHAESVEVGSRPHRPPLEPLVRWVKLRGMQGLDKRGRVRAKVGPGTTTARHSKSVASQLHAGITDAMPVDQPEAIARSIQEAIMRAGTKPHWFARKAMPYLMKDLDWMIREALEDK